MAKKKDNTTLYLGIAAVAGVAVYLATRKKEPTSSIAGIMTTPRKLFDRVKKQLHSGKEKVVNDTLHFGVGLYADKQDLISSGVKYSASRNDLFGHIENDQELLKFIHWLERKDGYLYVS